MDEEVVTLWRPVSPAELNLIRASGMRAFPPRLPEQPIFYPVLSEAYAIKIARDWNVPAHGRGMSRGFESCGDFLIDIPFKKWAGRVVSNIGYQQKIFSAFNSAIIAEIEVVAEFPSREQPHE
jgi:hypothetical protein